MAGALVVRAARLRGHPDEIVADGTWVRHSVTFGQDMRSWDLMGSIGGHAPDLFAWHTDLDHAALSLDGTTSLTVPEG